MTSPHPELERLADVMHRLRAGCPWDAAQTHESLVHYLVEECLEVVEAIEVGTDDDLAEELGDVLLQVVFHAEIAAGEGRFDLEDVARRITNKLIARHPYVFTDAEIPDDLNAAWEQNKAREKGRDSALDGIPQRLSALSRAHKVLSRSANLGVELNVSAADAADAEALGDQLVALVVRARELGIDPEQAARASVRRLEEQVRQHERGV